jgi:hypothetical protein
MVAHVYGQYQIHGRLRLERSWFQASLGKKSFHLDGKKLGRKMDGMEIITLSEISQAQKTKYCMFLFTCGI